MADSKIEVREYITEDGRNPFQEWLIALRDREARARIRIRLDRIQLGNLGDAKSVGRGVSELRIPYGPGYRLYFGREGTSIVILLCGGNKQSQRQDIAEAQGFWADYNGRKR